MLGAAVKVALDYTGYQTSSLAASMRICQIAEAPLMMHVVKMYNNPEGNKFFCLARIYSGSIKGLHPIFGLCFCNSVTAIYYSSVGQQVKVLGEAYTVEDDEDMAIVEVTGISVSIGRYFIEVNSAVAGNWY